MARPGVLLAGITINGNSNLPLHRQLFLALRTRILEGNLPGGTRLPATRVVAEDLGISRNTVLQAFEQLVDEGFLQSHVGRGTFVTDEVPANLFGVRSHPVEEINPTLQPSPRGKLIASLGHPRDQRRQIPFALGIAALDRFPMDIWRRLQASEAKESDRHDLSHGHRAGYGPLQAALCAHLTGARGLRCQPNQILIVSSSQAAFFLAATVLADPGDTVWMEEPGYAGARGAFVTAGLKSQPLFTGVDGWELTWPESPPRLMYVTPSHQFPTGTVMPLADRLALLDYAQRHQSWIVEDDYDSEFHHEGRPIGALQGLSDQARVIYVGTFSKVLFPSLRLAYLVVPKDLIETFLAARYLMDGHPPVFQQMVLAKFIQEGHFSSHLRRMRPIYKQRRDALIRGWKEHFGDQGTFYPHSTGLHLTVECEALMTATEIGAIANETGLILTPLSRYYTRDNAPTALVLGFGATPTHEIRDALAKLAKAIKARS